MKLKPLSFIPRCHFERAREGPVRKREEKSYRSDRRICYSWTDRISPLATLNPTRVFVRNDMGDK